MSSGVSRQTLDGAVGWAVDVLGVAVTARRPLTGALSAGMVALETRGGDFALRWWEEPGRWPAACLARQRAALDALVGTDLPVPRCVASDDTVPAAVTTWLPGEIDLDPVDPQRWITALADTLVAIHRVPPPPMLPPSDAASDPKLDPDLDWLDDPGLAAEARALIATPSTDPPALLHGDYQHFNVVWRNGHLSGVIDWPLGGAGDRGLDVGHCRLQPRGSVRCRRRDDVSRPLRGRGGQPGPPSADLTELLAFSAAWPSFIPRQVAGRRPVDGPGMAGRVRATLVETLRRAG